MAKITVVLCDVKPCNLPAERELDFNGQILHVCGGECYVKFWNREHANWKATRYRTQVRFDLLDRDQDGQMENEAGNMTGTNGVNSNLQIVRLQ